MLEILDSPLLREEHLLFRREVRRFVEQEVKPHGLQWEQDGRVPKHVLRRMGELGMLGVRFPQRYGGSDGDVLLSVVLAEELGRSTFGGFAITVLTQTDTATPILARCGNEEQLARFLPRIVSGESVAAIALTEPDAGSDVGALRTRATRRGDEWVLNGSKIYVTNGVYADVYFIAARTGAQDAGTRALSVFVVEKGTPGLTVARGLDKMGWRSSDTAELVLEDCRVPARNLLGEENAGFLALRTNLQNERLVLGAQAMGEAVAAIELTVRYATERKVFGAPLWEKQAVRHRLAALLGRVEAARQLVYATGFAHAQGRPCFREVAMVKALCGELVNEVVYACQQFHGGFGYMREATIERMVRDARIHAIGGGATEVMLDQVAKRMT